MKRQSHEPEMMGAAEAARTLGVKQSNLRVVTGLPEPYQKIRSGTLWRATEIRALAWSRLNQKTTAKHFRDDHTHTDEEPIPA
jgi:hypothetical protein